MVLACAAALTGLPAAASAASLYPDLETLPPRDLRFDTTDVSQDGSGVIHNVVRFSNTVWNTGPGQLVVRGTINPTTRSGGAFQRVFDDVGGFTDFAVGNFYWHDVHSHYHFDDWGTYQLWTKAEYDQWIANGRSQGQAKKVGTKTTSCVMDEEFIATNANTPYPAVYPSSGCFPNAQNLMTQGISDGWGDTYDYYRFEQWIDLGAGGSLADGQYVLRSVTDPLNKIYESAGKSDTAREGQPDNEATTVFTIQAGNILDSHSPSGTVSINHVDPTTTQTNVAVQAIGRDDVSGVDQVRLSNNGQNWATYTYTGVNSTPMEINWNLADAATGGSSTPGTRTVYAQFRDRSGKWSSTHTDTITLQGPPAATPYSSAVLADTPAGYWRLGETGGTAANDSAGANTGTYTNGPVLGAAGLLAAEPSEKAVRLDGTNDHVRVPGTSSLNATANVSLEAWIKPNALPASGSFASIVSKPESYSLQFNGPRLELTIIQSGARRRLQAPVGAVAAGQTYHVVGTYDGANQRLYINGSQVATAPLTGAISSASGLYIGSWAGSQEFFNGTIDEAAVYNRVLSAARAQAHFGTGTSTTQITISPPTGLSATPASTSRVDLTWTDAANNETGYVLERATNSSFNGTTSFNLPANSTTFADTTVGPGTTYYYRVKAINGATSSTYSNSASATTPSPPSTIPAAPTNLSAGQSGNKKHPRIALAWTDNATNETNYVIERSPDGATWSTLTTLSANTLSFTDSAVQSATTYYYRVRATNSAGPSNYSNVASATTR